MGKQTGIQVARAAAAVGILYFHSWVALVRFPEGRAYQVPIWTDYGYLAVDLFFAISGYVICLVVTKPQFRPIPFLVKRAFRLYPLWLVTLAAFAALALLWRDPTETETWRYFLYSATLLPTKALPFYDVGWSLQHEMAFYALAALIVPFGGISGLVAFLVASTVAAHAIEMPWYLSSLAVRHFEFLAGIFAFLLAPRLSRCGSRSFAIGPWFGVGAHDICGLQLYCTGLVFLSCSPLRTCGRHRSGSSRSETHHTQSTSSTPSSISSSRRL